MIELPFPPTNVKAIRYDTQAYRAINVSWTGGFDGNSPVLKFIIQRREVPELGNYLNSPLLTERISHTYKPTRSNLKKQISLLVNLIYYLS